MDPTTIGNGPGIAYRLVLGGDGATAGVVSTSIVVRVTKIVISGHASSGQAAAEFAEDTCALFFDKQVFTKNSDADNTAAGALGIVTIDVKELRHNTTVPTQARTSKMTKAINVYSFALKPEEHQPSGTCNFSRIDNAQLNFGDDLDESNSQNLYAVNYNVLRIMSGMGGLAYSN